MTDTAEGGTGAIPAIIPHEHGIDHAASAIFDILDDDLNSFPGDEGEGKAAPAAQKKAPAKAARKATRESTDEGSEADEADAEADASDPYAAFDDSSDDQPGKSKAKKAGDETDEAAGDDEQTGEEGEGDDTEDPTDDSIQIKWKTKAGEDFDVPLGELKNGFMRQTDYTAKTQELSATKQALGKAVERAAGEHKARFSALDDLITGLTELAVGKIQAPDPKLIETDMEAYQSQKAHYELQESTWSNLAGEVAKMKAETEAQVKAAFERFKAGERSKLPKAIPILGDAKRGLRVWQAMHQELRDRGKTDAEIASVASVVDWTMVHDSMMYRLQRKAAENTQDDVRKKSHRPMRSGKGRSRSSGSAARKSKSRSRAMETQRTEDHAAAILDVMPDL
jgi:hypothetical protein